MAARRRLEEHMLRYRFEINKLRFDAYADACDRAGLTPPLMCYRPEEWTWPDCTPEQGSTPPHMNRACRCCCPVHCSCCRAGLTGTWN